MDESDPYGAAGRMDGGGEVAEYAAQPYAQRLIEMYGHAAEARAVKRIVQMEEIGHGPSAAIWRGILEAIREILYGK
jgi:hypothetical protein